MPYDPGSRKLAQKATEKIKAKAPFLQDAIPESQAKFNGGDFLTSVTVAPIAAGFRQHLNNKAEEEAARARAMQRRNAEAVEGQKEALAAQAQAQAERGREIERAAEKLKAEKAKFGAEVKASGRGNHRSMAAENAIGETDIADTSGKQADRPQVSSWAASATKSSLKH